MPITGGLVLGIVEFPQNREMGYCCGGGGDLEAVDADVARKSAERLAGIVVKTEVDELIAACQQCKRMVMSVFKDRGIKIKVRDVVELVNDITV